MLARTSSVRRRLTCLTLDDPARVVLGSEPVFAEVAGEDGCVGYVTSASYGYTTGTSIAYAWPPSELAEPGQAVTIGWFDERLPAAVRAEPLFDPNMSRLRA